eukprot:scaffold140284_cov40-Cyclotella_meneghiniana.AAC.6
MTSSPIQAYEAIIDLCFSDDPESELLRQLAAILTEHPGAVKETDGDGRTLLHYAASYRSPKFCQMLIEIDSDLVRNFGMNESLPFNESCGGRNFETAKYLFGLYPESISIPDNLGFYPLHNFCSGRRTFDDYVNSQVDNIDFVKFLLEHDRGAISAATPDRLLPLHLVCRNNDCYDIIKFVYDAYPEAIHVKHDDGNGSTPLDDARDNDDFYVVDFFETQLAYEHQAREVLAPDVNGQLPIHLAIGQRRVSVGTIKLMLAANPNSIIAVDNQGSTPLHLACRAGEIDKVKYLVEVNEGILKMCNARGEYPLQIACQYGRCDIINFILENSDHGVSVKNAEKKLPIQVLLFDPILVDRDSLEFVEAVGRLLFAYPVNPADLAKEEDDETKNEKVQKRKFESIH